MICERRPRSTPEVLGPRPGLTVLGCLLLASVATTNAWGDLPDGCPESIVFAQRYVSSPPFPTETLVYDSTFTFETAGYARIRFDRTRGTLALSASSGGRLNAAVRIVERFEIVGVPPGTEVDAVIELRLEGWSEQNCGGSGCGVRLEGTLVMGADSVKADANQSGPSYGSRPLAATLRFPVRFTAGAAVEAQCLLDYGTGAGGGATAQATGTYGVTDLPAGVRAIACPGADLTPVRRTSWGTLKTTYR